MTRGAAELGADELVREQLDAMDEAALRVEFQRLEAQVRADRAAQAGIIAEVARRGLHTVDGHSSVRGWCRALANWSDAEVTTMVRLSRLVSEEQAVFDALASGRIGLAQASALARARANPRCGSELGQTLGVLLRHAEHLPHGDFVVVVRRWEQLADADGAHRSHDASHEGRRASVSVVGDTVRVHAQFGAVQGAALLEVFRQYVQREAAEDWAWATAVHGDAACAALLPRTGAQRSADALHQICMDAVAAPPGGVRPEPVVHITCDERSFERGLARLLGADPEAPWPGRSEAPSAVRVDPDPRHAGCGTVSGIPIDPVDAVFASLVGRVRRVVYDSAGVIVDAGHLRRLFTGPQRDLVLRSSQSCCWAGCAVPAPRCEADHSDDWRHGGRTDLRNGGPMCPRHNKLKNLGFRVRRDGDGYWHTSRPDGSEIV